MNDLQSKLDQAKVSLAGLSQPAVSGMRVLDRAEIPTRASSVRNVALQAGAVGLSLALLILIGGILLLTLIDSTLRRPEEVERVLDLKPVGTIPRLT
jgi:capsular polysaccharide biosynthesis protein